MPSAGAMLPQRLTSCGRERKRLSIKARRRFAQRPRTLGDRGRSGEDFNEILDDFYERFSGLGLVHAVA
ncbi:hypothetical protein D3C87_704070 [compost metagenome]